MCGRFALKTPKDEIKEYLGIDVCTTDLIENYNIAPTNNVSAIINHKEIKKLGNLQWGLIPRWAKDSNYQSKMINARSETLEEKPSFKEAFQNRRCLIIADGYYEWEQYSNEKKPHYIFHKTNKVFTFAGLWDIWLNPNNEKVKTCTIITTKANKTYAKIHERMPVVIERENQQQWLNTEETPESLKSLLLTPSEDTFQNYIVSQFVNSVKNNSPECIKLSENVSLFE
ncbi:MAG: hypothetical protein COA79_11035 [Planctomycetota bacterium]|nr:MAG: hypothetical protein COA79_11035 [Planctomycetota bacterium]